jgi:hypothetical protein
MTYRSAIVQNDANAEEESKEDKNIINDNI